MYQKGIAKVSLRVSLWDWREFGKKEQFQALHANMNELLALQGIAFGSSPYRFPWFGAPFKKKSASQEDSYMKSLAGFSYAPG